ncbi:MAG: glycoside hydrolase domain-containing protein [Bacteroidota bacterium]
MKSKDLKIFFFIISMIMFFYGHNAWAADYGYNLGNDEKCAIWWTEGTYKVMYNTPVPEGKTVPMKIFSAANEYESVQIVLSPLIALHNFKIKAGDLKSKSGNIISIDDITIRKVEYVHVTIPSDDYCKPGWYPEPLPVFDTPADIQPGKNQPFYITVKVPVNTIAGEYEGMINLISDEWSKEIPISVKVWNFALPENASMKSSFGFPTTMDMIKAYHNLDTDEEIKEVTDKYYHMMSEYKIAPTDPFRLYPPVLSIKGLEWSGGIFTSDTVYSGEKALKVVDNNVASNMEARTNNLIEVNHTNPYILTWNARTAQSSQKYSVLVKCFDAEKVEMLYENRIDVFTGNTSWNVDTLKIRPFREEIKYVTIHLFPVFRNLPLESSTHLSTIFRNLSPESLTGTAWFDEIRLVEQESKKNLLVQGDFEVNLEELHINIDFKEFDKAGKKYLDELGFNVFHLPLEGMPSGTYFSQKRGIFYGFAQGTAEYNVLMKKYLSAIQEHIENKGWLGKEYVYWFDEPGKKDYPFVREGMEILKQSAPKLTRFITEHSPGPEIMDITDIGCTVLHHVNPEVIKKYSKQGREYWSYLCVNPKSPYINLFIDSYAVNLRMWLWLTYKYEMKGILVWSAIYWNSITASPIGHLQNPWEDPISYQVGYGVPFGAQVSWRNGVGRFFYPPNREPNNKSKKYFEGPVPSLQLEILRDGIEDYDYLVLLEKALKESGDKNQKFVKKAQKLLSLPESLVKSATEFNKDPQAMIQYRNKIGELLDAYYK